MRRALACLVGLVVVAACAKGPASANSANAAASPATSANAAAAPATPATTPAAGPPVSGVYTGGGKSAQLTEVTAHKDDPFDGQPVTALVFTAQPQGDDASAATDALLGQFGDAIIVRVEPDGTVIGADLVHHGLDKTSGSISVVGVLSLKGYKAANGEISGELTSGGPSDVFGQPVNVDLTFHTKAP